MLFSSWPFFTIKFRDPNIHVNTKVFSVFTVKIICRDISRSYIFAENVNSTSLSPPSPKPSSGRTVRRCTLLAVCGLFQTFFRQNGEWWWCRMTGSVSPGDLCL